uniref:Spt20-like SEP domain-containing protein n=1 Tax=Hordeum vulgare subsp. vulgare TaxID=112509 RepID=A0A8I6XJ24_HORVV
MVVSFKLHRRGRRFYPPPPPASAPAADAPDAPPKPPREAAAARPGLGGADRSSARGADPADSGLEASFALNLFPDGYSVGGLDKGMLVFLIGDDPEKKPYTRASRALLSDIEYGCLPKDILHGIPCKFQNGVVVCEVRDYRSFLSNGDDSSEYDFPIMNRIALRLGTECVVNDLSLIADASWTYHEQLIAESTIINSLQPMLNLDPKPCLEKLCNSVKKIDLGLHNGRWRMKETSLLNSSPGPPEKRKPEECDGWEGAAVCIENSALEVLPSGILSCSPVNCPSPPQVNSAKSTVVSDPEDTTQCSSTIINSSAFCDREQSASSTPASDNFLQNHDQQADLAIVKVDHKKGPLQPETVLPQKRKECSNLVHERRFSDKSARLSFQSSNDQFQKSAGASNKGLMLGSPKEPSVEDMVDQTIGNKDMEVHQHKSFSTPSLNIKDPFSEKFAEKVNQGSRKELPVEVMVDQTMGKKDMRLQEQKPFSVIPTNHPFPSFNRNDPCLEQFPEKVKLGSGKELPVEVKLEQAIGRGKENEPLSILPTTLPQSSLIKNSLHVEKIPEKVHSSHTTMRESHLVSFVDVGNHGGELKDSSVTSVTSCNASSGNADAKPHEDKASMEPQPTTSKIKVSGTSTISLNQQINFEGNGQKQADILVRRSCEDRSSIEPGVTDGTSSQSGISPDIELCIGYPLYNIEPNIEKILSEVILTTQRHAPDGNADKIDGVETLTQLNSCLPSCIVRYESAEGSPYTREETISCCLTRRMKHTRNIRSFVFHCVQYFCGGIVDQSHYILCLLESESPEDHQIAVEMISGDERFHIATLPTSDQAKKFVDQFILLMKRDGYTLCNSTVCNGFSEPTQQSADVSQPGYLTGEHSQYQEFSPSVAKSIVINECKDTGFASEKRLPDVHANARQQGSQQWGLPDVHAAVLHQGSRQWGLPDVHANAQPEGSQQWGMRDAHRNASQHGSRHQQWGQPYAHTNVPQQGGNQQWGQPYAHTNVPQHKSNQQWGQPYAHANVAQQGSNQQWEQPYAHANVAQQGSNNQQWGQPYAQANVAQQGSNNQQWGQPYAQANVPQQGSYQQWGQPHPHTHANVPRQGGNQQRGQTYAHANVRLKGSKQQRGMPDAHANLRHQGKQQWSLPDDHSTNAMHQGSQQQWVQPEKQPSASANVGTPHFSNPGYPAEQQYSNRVFQQDQRWPPFSGGTCSTNQHQHQHHHYPQSRQDTPRGSDERYAATTSMGAGSYGQRHHQAPHRQKRGGRRTYPWGFQDSSRQVQINNLPPMQAGRSVVLSTLRPAGGTQTSSPTTGSDGCVTSTFLACPSGYDQHPPPHGIC